MRLIKLWGCVLLFLAGLFWGTGMQPYKESKEPEVEIVDSKGTIYELSDWIVETVPVTGRRERVTGTILYEKIEMGDEIPEEADIEVSDEESDKTFHVMLPLIGTKFSNERWEDNFKFQVTFHTYGAEYYTLGELKVPSVTERSPGRATSSEAELLLPAGFEKAILAEIGRTEEYCRIERCEWSGGTYTDSNGIQCRDATVFGRQKVSDCKATYRGTVSMPDYEQYQKRARYSPKTEVMDSESERKLVATPSETSGTSFIEAPERKTIWDRLIAIGKTCLQISIGLGCIWLAFCFFRMLLRLVKKTEEKKHKR